MSCCVYPEDNALFLASWHQFCGPEFKGSLRTTALKRHRHRLHGACRWSSSLC